MRLNKRDLFYYAFILILLIAIRQIITMNLNTSLGKTKPHCGKTKYIIGGQIYYVYNPLFISREAIAYYESRPADWKRKFMECVKILTHLLVRRNNLTLVLYNFPWPKYNIPPNWTSAMAQASAIITFHYAYLLTKNQTYESLSDKLIDAFYVNVDEGGLTHNLSGSYWYEEYAHPNIKGPFVLNGFMSTLLDLYKAYKLKNDTRLLYLFLKGIGALKKMINRFDNGSWTMYDLQGTEAPWNYHEIHIKWAEKIYEITGDNTIRKYVEKWIRYKYSPKGGFKWLEYNLKKFIENYLLFGPITYVLAFNMLLSALLLLIIKIILKISLYLPHPRLLFSISLSIL